MIKKLKIRFVKFERYLVAQQLEMTGKEHFTPSEHVALLASGIDFADAAIWLSRSCNFNIGIRCFNHNDERDEYLDKVVKWISEEQFATVGKLEIGKECEVSDNSEDWVERRLIAVLPENYSNKYIAQTCDDKNKWTYWNYARSIDFIQPQIDGDVYTWSLEVSE